MEFLFTLIGNPFSLQLPHSITGWGIIGFYAIIIYWRLKHWHDKANQKEQGRSVLLALLILLVPFTSLFLGISINSLGEVQNNLYGDATVVMLYSAIGGDSVDPRGRVNASDLCCCISLGIWFAYFVFYPAQSNYTL